MKIDRIILIVNYQSSFIVIVECKIWKLKKETMKGYEYENYIIYGAHIKNLFMMLLKNAGMNIAS
ncbi:hypothetical protein CLPU_7c01040 [Gottschalkia purinilytica]|uniref:Uncharacterized protein n=1 Tax=Gottschalkia purinilytica TaxID=1503 RepID=A0A0L0WAG6_GOTPU|nr:hypothetical protein CLPU_7c01040 [Gottschalkia purinilytica]